MIMTVVALAAWASASVRGQLPDRLPKKWSEDFARAAVRGQMEPKYRRRPLGADDLEITKTPHFYTWIIVPSWGEGVEFMYVDRRTGTVWDNFCSPMHSPGLSVLQARFRRQYDVPPALVLKIERKGSPREECGS